MANEGLRYTCVGSTYVFFGPNACTLALPLGRELTFSKQLLSLLFKKSSEDFAKETQEKRKLPAVKKHPKREYF